MKIRWVLINVVLTDDFKKTLDSYVMRVAGGVTSVINYVIRRKWGA